VEDPRGGFVKKFYRKYETLVIVRPELSEDESTRVWDRISGVLGRLDGHEIKREVWGKRKLAFEIKKNKKGVYLYLLYLGGNDLVLELERNLRLLDDVLKYQTVKLADNVDLESFDFDKEREVVTFISDGGDEEEEGERREDDDRRRRRRDDDESTDDDDDDDEDED
jgi:small subunit ribosomal protein S6